jgi:hypothetical protein
MNDFLSGLSFNSSITVFITKAEELKKLYIEVHLNKIPVDSFFKRKGMNLI